MSDRTEEAALAGRLSISVGGETVVLRTLNLDESEEWLGKVGTEIAGFDLPGGLDAPETFDVLARAPARVMLGLVLAYDLDGVLPPVVELRKRLTQRELYAALRGMAEAEVPFATDLRSAVAAFGPQIRTAVGILAESLASRSRPALSTNGRSPIGDSIPELSVVGSDRNDSSSSGGTDRNASRGSVGKRP